MASKKLIPLSIVIPVYKSESSLEELVDRTFTSLKDFLLEIVLVNDGSPDRSHLVCVKLQKKYPKQLTYLRLAKNFGEHNAVITGLRYVTSDFALIMDDDNQNSPDDVRHMFSAMLSQEADVVFGDYRQKQHSLFRNLGSQFNDLIATWMLGKPKDLYLCSFKLMNRFVINEVIRYHGPYPYIDGLILRCTSALVSVEVSHQPRQSGASNYTFVKLIRLWLAMFTNFSILPLRVSAVIGFTVAFLSFIYAGVIVYEKIVHDITTVGWSSLFIALTFFSGVQLMSLGLIGEYLGRLFLTENKTPQSVVREAYLSSKK